MRTNTDLILRYIYGKHILMPIRKNAASNEPVYLNDIAACIWKSADESDNPDELLGKICCIYNLKNDSAESEAVRHFISKLIEDGLLIE